jgi:hypothetical protein
MGRRDGIAARRGGRGFATVCSGTVESCRNTRRRSVYAVIIAFFGDEVEVNIFGEVGSGLAC